MAHVDIIFTPQYRDEAIAGAIAQGTPLPSNFRGPNFKDVIEAGPSAIEGFFTVSTKGVGDEVVDYLYPLSAINRIRVTK